MSSKKTTLALKLLPALILEPKLDLLKVEDPVDDTFEDLLKFMSPERLIVLEKESNMASMWIMFKLNRWPTDGSRTS